MAQVEQRYTCAAKAMLADMTLVDWLGVLGSIFIAGAYLAASQGWLDARRPGYNALNLIGAILILWSLFYRPNAGAILIEVLWIGIAIAALVRYAMRKDQP